MLIDIIKCIYYKVWLSQLLWNMLHLLRLQREREGEDSDLTRQG